MTAQGLPVHVLTGFLGAGKTTLLARWLRDPALRDTAVLVNEFGAVGLDHHLLQAMEGEVVLLANGCVCCSIRGDLAQSLNDLLRARAAGTVPPFSRIVIETTGLADPAPICATVLVDPRLRNAFRLGNIICGVDAELGPSQLQRHAVAARQAAVADRLIVTKTDRVNADTAAAVCQMLTAMNPTAALLQSSADATLGPEVVLNEGGFDPASRRSEVSRWTAAAAPVRFAFAPQNEPIDLLQARPIVLTSEMPLAWDRFVVWLTMLLHAHGERILRTKAILSIEGSATPVVLHAVQHIVHPPLHLAAWPDGLCGSNIVMIAEGIEADALRRSFAAFLLPGAA